MLLFYKMTTTRIRTRPMMRRSQQACWLLLAVLNTSSGFSPAYPAPSYSNCQNVKSPPPLYLVTEDDDGQGTPTTRKKGPFRRAVRRILRKKRTDEDNTMHMLTKESASTEQQVLTQDFVENLGLDANKLNTDFILQNFQDTTPNDVFPSDSTKQRRNVLTSDNNVVASLSVAPDFGNDAHSRTTKTSPLPQKQVKLKKKRPLQQKAASKYEGGSFIHRMTRSWFQNMLTGIIQRRSKVPPVGLRVRVAPSNVVKRMCRGQFRCDATIEFARVVFQNIRLTGGSLQAKKMTMSSFGPRYVNQFDIHANNCTLTEDDLFESSCIRNGLARLLVRILNNAGVTTSKIQITAVNIVVSFTR